MRQNATDVFIDGNNGDDKNDGLDAQAPLRTLQAGFDSLPAATRKTKTVHLRGSFDLSPNITSVISSCRELVIDGGDPADTRITCGGK